MNNIIQNLENMFPNPVCELEYNKDYELLISTMLSAQSTDKRVNMVAKKLYKYNLEELSKLNNEEIEKIIRSVGSYHKKAIYIKEIAKALLIDFKGTVPNNRTYLESLPGVGRKTASVVLANLFNEPSVAVDTHVTRVSNILNIVKNEGNVIKIENKLKNTIPKDKWNRVNSQMVLFGRYICKAKKPDCDKCLFNKACKNRLN